MFSTRRTRLRTPYIVSLVLGVRSNSSSAHRFITNQVSCDAVLAGTTVLTFAAYGGVILRVFLGEEAFMVYYGDNLRDWIYHCFDFTLVPFSLILSDTTLFDIVLPVSLVILYVSSRPCEALLKPLIGRLHSHWR